MSALSRVFLPFSDLTMKSLLFFLCAILYITEGCHNPCQSCITELNECKNRKNQVTALLQTSEQKESECNNAIATEKRKIEDCMREAESRVIVVAEKLSIEKNDHENCKGKNAELEEQLRKERKELEDCKTKAQQSEEQLEKKLAALVDERDKCWSENKETNEELQETKTNLKDCKSAAVSTKESLTKQLNNAQKAHDECEEGARKTKEDLQKKHLEALEECKTVATGKETQLMQKLDQETRNRIECNDSLQLANGLLQEKKQKLEECELSAKNAQEILTTSLKGKQDELDSCLLTSQETLDALKTFMTKKRLQTDMKRVVLDVIETLQNSERELQLKLHECEKHRYSFVSLLLSFSFGGAIILLVNLVAMLSKPSAASLKKKLKKSPKPKKMSVGG